MSLPNRECCSCGSTRAITAKCVKCGAYYCEICHPVESQCIICAPRTIALLPMNEIKDD